MLALFFAFGPCSLVDVRAFCFRPFARRSPFDYFAFSDWREVEAGAASSCSACAKGLTRGLSAVIPLGWQGFSELQLQPFPLMVRLPLSPYRSR